MNLFIFRKLAFFFVAKVFLTLTVGLSCTCSTWIKCCLREAWRRRYSGVDLLLNSAHVHGYVQETARAIFCFADRDHTGSPLYSNDKRYLRGVFDSLVVGPHAALIQKGEYLAQRRTDIAVSNFLVHAATQKLFESGAAGNIFLRLAKIRESQCHVVFRAAWGQTVLWPSAAPRPQPIGALLPILCLRWQTALP